MLCLFGISRFHWKSFDSYLTVRLLSASPLPSAVRFLALLDFAFLRFDMRFSRCASAGCISFRISLFRDQRCSFRGFLAGRLAHGEPSKRYMREKAGCAPFLTACRSFTGSAPRAPLSLCAPRIFVRFRSAFEAFASPVSGDDRPGIAMRHCLLACLPRKEVIQPHLPIRLPCYDFTPVI